MDIVYCFVEREDEALKNFIEKYDDTCEIHIFSPISNSCERKLFFCLGEITNLFLETEEKAGFVTDVPEIYEHVCNMYHSYFIEVIYLEQGVKNAFDSDIDYQALFKYETLLLLNPKGAAFIEKMLLTLTHDNELGICDKTYDVLEDMRIILEDAILHDNWREKSSWAHLVEMILFYLQEKEWNNLLKIALYSILMRIENNVAYTNQLLQLVLDSKIFKKDNRYFVWNQFKRIRLNKLADCNQESESLLDAMYQNSYEAYYTQEKKNLHRIPQKDLHPKRILVLAIQFLTTGHAPTKSVVERCKTLIKAGYEVYLVNTTEQYITKGVIPFFMGTGGSIVAEYDKRTEMDLDGYLCKFKQFPRRMTMEERIQQTISIIKDWKPYYILSIGSGSMIADLCGNMVPCASMALAFSTLPKTMNRMKILGRELTAIEKSNQNNEDIIVESRFTFELKEQEGTLTREELLLPEDDFLLVVVGIWLDYELDDAFLTMLSKVLEKGCHIVFAGDLKSYEQLCKAYPILEEHSSFIGYCNNIPALMEICDLYVNPNRLGGGFSVIEAFDKKVPGVYLPTGDVATAGGKDFEVADYEEMVSTILRYKSDKEFYMEMAEKAKRRAEYMTDSLSAIKEIDSKIRREIALGNWEKRNS